MTGDLGFLIERDGRQFIKLDRPNQEILRPFNAQTSHEWQPDAVRRPLTNYQIGMVAFAADKALKAALGLHDTTKNEKAWLDLSDSQRRLWMEKGPVVDPVRASLYKAIMDELRPLTEG